MPCASGTQSTSEIVLHTSARAEFLAMQDAGVDLIDRVLDDLQPMRGPQAKILDDADSVLARDHVEKR